MHSIISVLGKRTTLYVLGFLVVALGATAWIMYRNSTGAYLLPGTTSADPNEIYISGNGRTVGLTNSRYLKYIQVYSRVDNSKLYPGEFDKYPVNDPTFDKTASQHAARGYINLVDVPNAGKEPGVTAKVIGMRTIPDRLQVLATYPTSNNVTDTILCTFNRPSYTATSVSSGQTLSPYNITCSGGVFDRATEWSISLNPRVATINYPNLALTPSYTTKDLAVVLTPTNASFPTISSEIQLPDPTKKKIDLRAQLVGSAAGTGARTVRYTLDCAGKRTVYADQPDNQPLTISGNDCVVQNSGYPMVSVTVDYVGYRATSGLLLDFAANNSTVVNRAPQYTRVDIRPTLARPTTSRLPYSWNYTVTLTGGASVANNFILNCDDTAIPAQTVAAATSVSGSCNFTRAGHHRITVRTSSTTMPSLVASTTYDLNLVLPATATPTASGTPTSSATLRPSTSPNTTVSPQPTTSPTVPAPGPTVPAPGPTATVTPTTSSTATPHPTATATVTPSATPSATPCTTVLFGICIR